MQKLFPTQLCPLDPIRDNFSFPLNYRADILADMHTPQELAAMNDCTDILRYLDGVVSKQVRFLLSLTLRHPVAWHPFFMSLFNVHLHL